MAITSAGYDGTVNEAEWAKIGKGQRVFSGLDVSVGAGTRALAISSGSAVVCHNLVESSATETRTAAANATGAIRRDYVIAKLVWATNTTTIEVKTGTASLPGLTQNPGVTWEMPLAKIEVGNGATTIPAANITPCKPTALLPNYFSVVLTPTTIFATSTGANLGGIDITDPGWPYRLEVDAHVRSRWVSGTTGGTVELSARVDGVEFAVRPGIAFTQTNMPPLDVWGFSPILTGTCRVSVAAAANGMPSPGSVETFGAGTFNTLNVKQVPV